MERAAPLFPTRTAGKPVFHESWLCSVAEIDPAQPLGAKSVHQHEHEQRRRREGKQKKPVAKQGDAGELKPGQRVGGMPSRGPTGNDDGRSAREGCRRKINEEDTDERDPLGTQEAQERAAQPRKEARAEYRESLTPFERVGELLLLLATEDEEHHACVQEPRPCPAAEPQQQSVRHDDARDGDPPQTEQGATAPGGVERAGQDGHLFGHGEPEGREHQESEGAHETELGGDGEEQAHVRTNTCRAAPMQTLG